MDKNYIVRLDLVSSTYNPKMRFNQYDKNVNTFYIELTKDDEVIENINRALVTLVVIKPDNSVEAQFLTVVDGKILAELDPQMCDIPGKYTARAIVVIDEEVSTTNTITYEVNEDKILSKLNNDTVNEEKFKFLSDALIRLSFIESTEDERQMNEAQRIINEDVRKLNEKDRIDAELIREHEEVDRAKYEHIRKANENTRENAEEIRATQERVRQQNESERLEAEEERKVNDAKRNEDFNIIVNDANNFFSQVATFIQQENQRVANEEERAREEFNRRTVEQARVRNEQIRQDNENARVSSEQERLANEEIRQDNEDIRIANEDERINNEVSRKDRYDTLISDLEQSINEFGVNIREIEANEDTRQLEEQHRQANEVDRILNEQRRIQNENTMLGYEDERKTSEETRKVQELERVSNENERVAQEQERVANEVNRVSSENTRKTEYATFKSNFTSTMNEFNLFYNEAKDKAQEVGIGEDTRVANENIRVENEVTRISNENARVEAEAQRLAKENERLASEETRLSNEELREVNEIERNTNENSRKQSEANRVSDYNSLKSNFNTFAKSAEALENGRIENENQRIYNESLRQNNEIIRQNNDTTRSNQFNAKITEVNNKVNEVDKKIIELNTTKDNFVSSINTKVDTKISEIEVAKSDMTNTVSNKVNEVETRFNALTSSQQQDAEVIDARDGETSLKARLDRDIEKAKEIYAPIEGSHISTDSSSGYAKDVEILGNTIQDASNLADIRSVGDKVEGQELYEIPVLSLGKNLFDIDTVCTTYEGITKISNNEIQIKNRVYNIGEILKLDKSKSYKLSGNFSRLDGNGTSCWDWYDSNGNIQYTSIVQPNWTKIEITFSDHGTSRLKNPQIEEGTVETPYEPYQEDKLTILSPVQLEKVGDVRDRIIEKDGVLGVEKNVKLINVNDLSVYDTISLKNWKERGCRINFIYANDIIYNDSKVSCMFNRILSVANSQLHNHTTFPTVNSGGLTSDGYIRIHLDIPLEYGEVNKANAIRYLKDLNLTMLVGTTKPQFIPLPHDQQVKLRTFANKTNISFLTEIEGTIKAQVPKSLGATVNTHTEQISNLNKELDRVKKLEESTVSTVTTESDFTTVEATSNGYFEDVKLEGKTLVNKLNPISNITEGDTTFSAHTNTILEPSVYTVINNSAKEVFFNVNNASNGDYITTITLKAAEKSKLLKYDVRVKIVNFGGKKDMGWNENNKEDLGKQIILEGDHTQNPPSFFEGLMSVGQSATTSEDGADEIVVLSSNVNSFCTPSYYRVPTFSEVERNVPNSNIILIKNGSTTQNILFTDNSIERLDTTGHYFGQSHKIKVKNLKPNAEYQISYNIDFKQSKPVWCGFLDTDRNNIPISSNHTRITRIRTSNHLGEIEGFMFVSDDWIKYSNIEIKLKESSVDDYTPHQSDKKRLLYYNNETQAWEKPILRQWDSIEKHADGKYYYHKRSGEVVLNGSEGWRYPAGQDGNNTILLYSRISDAKINQNYPICDRFNGTYLNIWDSTTDIEGILINHNSDCVLRINKSKLPTQDVAGFKQWLQANNVTVVYQLAQEKVYECTNIDLITYANETNYIVECGAIAPKSTLKVHNNISNVVSLLQKKVSILETKFTEMFKFILSGDVQSLAYSLYPEDFEDISSNTNGFENNSSNVEE